MKINFSFLNAKQQQIVRELDRNILLLASAGTGKTNTLSYRIANILMSERAKPEEIICLTFTNKACNEMKKRIVEVVGESAQGVTVKTFHGFCYHILQQAAKDCTDLPVDFTVFDEVDCLEIIRSLKLCPPHQANAMQALINLLKEYRGEYNIFTDKPAEDYDRVLRRLKSEKQQRINDAAKQRGGKNQDLLMSFESSCGKTVSAYDTALRENHAVDFSDLINLAYQVLQDGDVAAMWRRRFKFWSVDEVQDTSRLEYTILTKMFGQNNLLLCGDFFQTIYEWRGSEPQLLFEKFQQEYAPLLMVFNENYRSTQTLLQASYGFLQQRFAEQTMRLFKEAARSESTEEGEPIIHAVLPNTHTEANWIYERLQRLRPANLAQVCILTRSNWYNQKLSEELAEIQENRRQQWLRGERQEEDFPLEFMLVDEFKFFRRQEIKDVVAALRLLVNPHDNNSLSRLLKRFVAGIGPAAIERLKSAEYKEAGIRLTDFLGTSAQKYAEPFEELLRALEEGKAVIFDVETTGLDTARDEIIQIAAIRLDIRGNQLASLMRYVRATKPVGDSEAVHHISDAKLAVEGVAPAVALQEFLDFAQDCVIVGHNVTFDLTILASQLARLGLPKLKMLASYDTLDIFRRFYPNLPNYKLGFLGEYCKVTHRSSHDAFDDICATGEILLYAVRQSIVPTRDVRRAYVDRYVEKFAPFAKALNALRALMETTSLAELVARTVLVLGFNKFYARDDAGEENPANPRLENLRNLVRKARIFDAKNLSRYDALQDFLRLTALSNTELDLMLNDFPKIPIITVHQAKGSEFETVFLAGLQEGTFPSKISLERNSLEEEARLFYVAITRAKKRLFLTSPTVHSAFSCRFINAIPEEYIVCDKEWGY